MNSSVRGVNRLVFSDDCDGYMTIYLLHMVNGFTIPKQSLFSRCYAREDCYSHTYKYMHIYRFQLRKFVWGEGNPVFFNRNRLIWLPPIKVRSSEHSTNKPLKCAWCSTRGADWIRVIYDHFSGKRNLPHDLICGRVLLPWSRLLTCIYWQSSARLGGHWFQNTVESDKKLDLVLKSKWITLTMTALLS